MQTGTEPLTSQRVYDERFKKLVNEIHAASSPNAIMVGLRNKILTIYNVEMATIFLIDAKHNRLVSWVLLPGDSLSKIRMEINRASITGFVAETRKMLNIRNVYDSDELQNIDPSLTFDSSWDQKTGNKTRQVLATPVIHKANLMGVIELINKKGGADFNPTDESRIKELADTLAIALFNHYKSGKKIPMRYEELVNREIISPQEMERAMVIATQQEKEVETVLMENYLIPKPDLGDALAFVYKTGFVDLKTDRFAADSFVTPATIEVLRRQLIVPLEKRRGELVVAAKNPANQAGLLEVKHLFRVPKISVMLAFGDDIRDLLDAIVPPPVEDIHAGVGAEEQPDEETSIPEIYQKIEDQPADVAVDATPAVQLVNKMIEDAFYAGASDIHIEPYGNRQDAEVRFRIDGSCSNILNIPKANVKSVIARIKVLADLDIAERRKPQDGKMKFTTTRADNVELRVATLPTADGNEDVVLRILADSRPIPLYKLAPERTLNRLIPCITKPYGMFLVVGPTGSGKTTTLHSVLNYINTPERKIWTAEDPVEITQYRLRQVQVKPHIGYTFAAAMRAFLRADPDIIMIGEMRDQETAKMAIEASLTGHVVFSTLHTNSAAETVIRLIEMGMDPFNFSDSLLGILAQRLVRTLCEDCKEPFNPTQKEYDNLVHHYGVMFFEHLNIPYSKDLTLFRANGCDTCNHSGYKGRQGLYELLVANQKIKSLIIEKAPAEAIKIEAIEDGMTVLLQEGIHLIFAGKTDIKQVMSTCLI
ncbi:MAG: GspE/PulE family protein [Desulfofustis sp.]|jgi:type II secretory ATPase GspE/PulE/Tfp pilus assembly ATPase PilB-like protein|nr:GspE/PulE family protein [Desulfofustis sp.]